MSIRKFPNEINDLILRQLLTINYQNLNDFLGFLNKLNEEKNDPRYDIKFILLHMMY